MRQNDSGPPPNDQTLPNGPPLANRVSSHINLSLIALYSPRSPVADRVYWFKTVEISSLTFDRLFFSCKSLQTTSSKNQRAEREREREIDLDCWPIEAVVQVNRKIGKENEGGKYGER